MEKKPQVKWICPMCTYENWPKSIKCTVCLALRDLPLIEEEMLKKEKKRLSPPPIGWDCPQCTFRNLTTTVNCIQCACPSPSTSPSSPAQLPPLTNGQLKWSCPLCTYQNWPKTSKCTMCRTGRHIEEENEEKENSWLNACKALLTDEVADIQDYLFSSSCGPGELLQRKLTQKDCQLLDRWLCQSQILQRKDGMESPFKPGMSLVDLLARTSSKYHSNLASLFLDISSQPTPTDLVSQSLQQQQQQKKCSVCQTSPLMAREVRQMLAQAIRQRKGDFPCKYVSGEFSMFALPAASIRQLDTTRQHRLFSELLDTEVQTELEEKSEAINWWVELGENGETEMKTTSRLFALWNRTDGDCLLDSLLQASWGVFDKQRTLRQALSESLTACEAQFYRVWRDQEIRQTEDQYHLDELQLLRDWRSCLEAASQPREALEQIHIFVLSHILRRPIVVYSVKFINNYRDEPIGLANFQGVYLPMLWESSFCSKNPLVLGYTRGHFSALVPMELEEEDEPHCTSAEEENEIDTSNVEQRTPAHSVYLPLFDRQGIPLPVPFVSLPQTSETGVTFSSMADLLRDRLDTVSSTRRGLLLVRLHLPHPRHPFIEGLVNEWFAVYRSSSSNSTTSLVDDDNDGQEEIRIAAGAASSGCGHADIL